MPTLAEFMRADKTDVDEGKWHHGDIYPSAFKLSKARKKTLRFGPDYRWRLVKFRALGCKCRVLILFNESKLICCSSFAVEVEDDLAVLCHHEYHANHPGWHCHCTAASHEEVTAGLMRPRDRFIRMPRANRAHRMLEFGLSEASALSHVAARYRFQAQGGLL